MNKYKFPLGHDVHDSTDILNMITQLLTEKFTMGAQVEKFEKEFAKYVGSKYAVMVNSGSSANLLALSVLANYKCSNKLNPGDEVLVPVICWSTSIFPIIQNNLTPVFVDVDPKTLNMDLDDLERKITNKTKAIMAVHILGNCTDMERLTEIVKKYNLRLIEDTCESLGSRYQSNCLGTFGDIGTYSFYYSHHISCAEGGCLVTDNEELYELALCLRAHGWIRNLKNKEEIQAKHPDLDPRFTFVNLGYNIRPMEIQASMGLGQLKRLDSKNDYRKLNYSRIKKAIINDPSNNFLSFPIEAENADIAWFGATLFLDCNIPLAKYLDYLTDQGVENRPIVTGNVVRQPVIQDLYPALDPVNFPGAEHCHFHGLFIGLSCTEMSQESIQELVNILLDYK